MQADDGFFILLIEGKNKPDYMFAKSLTRRGYHLGLAESGSAGLALLEQFSPRVIVINCVSLRINGRRIMGRFRNLLPYTPIILITAPAQEVPESDQANVVLQLPFTVQKLINRLRAFEITDSRHLLSLDGLHLNTQTNMADYGSREVKLTPRLCRLLKELMLAKGEVIPRAELFKLVWETDYIEDTRTLDVHISWLRHALEDDPSHPELILTERGVGYKLKLG